MSNTSIWPTDGILSGGPWCDGNKRVLRIPQISSITGALPSDCLISYSRHSLGVSYPTTEMQSVYSTAPADWAMSCLEVSKHKKYNSVFLIWELIFIYCRLFFLRLGSFCVVSSFTAFRPNFTSGLLRVILPRPRIGMLSLVSVSPVITAFYSCCLSHHVFDQVNLLTK